MGRREQREQLFKLLFRIEFNTLEEMPEQVELFFEQDEIINENDIEFITRKYEKIQDKLSELDQLIDEKADGWNTKRLGKVELTVLRLSIFEILFDDDIPQSVAINEGIEISKKYGQESSGGFINAILAKFTEEKQ